MGWNNNMKSVRDAVRIVAAFWIVVVGVALAGASASLSQVVDAASILAATS